MISVLMSIYNEKKNWIKQAIDSILNQTYRNFEFIIIIDNPELDQEIKDYLFETQKLDHRIKYIWNNRNMGLAMSLNEGLKIASGKYIARMDADDISIYTRFERELQFIENSDFHLISSNKINIDEDGNILYEDSPIKRNPNTTLIYSNIIVHSSVLIKTDVMKEMGGYRELPNSEDYDLWLRMIDAGYKLGILNEYLLKYRIRKNSASVDRCLEQYYIDKYIIKLAKERKRGLQDTYSLTDQKEYINRKHITELKKMRFLKSNEYIQKALISLQRDVVKSIGYLLCSFIYYPVLPLGKMKSYYFSNR